MNTATVIAATAMNRASTADPTCSTSHTSRAARIPIVAIGATMSRSSSQPNWRGIQRYLQCCSLIAEFVAHAVFGSTLELLTTMADRVVRIAATGDLHCTKTSQGAFQPLFARIADSAELLLLAG